MPDVTVKIIMHLDVLQEEFRGRNPFGKCNLGCIHLWGMTI